VSRSGVIPAVCRASVLDVRDPAPLEGTEARDRGVMTTTVTYEWVVLPTLGFQAEEHGKESAVRITTAGPECSQRLDEVLPVTSPDKCRVVVLRSARPMTVHQRPLCSNSYDERVPKRAKAPTEQPDLPRFGRPRSKMVAVGTTSCPSCRTLLCS
jgi:hypothetical protein